MGRFLSKVFEPAFSSCKRHKIFLISMIVATVIVAVIGIIGGLQLHKSLFPQNFSNVAYIKFLKRGSGFVSFLFNTLLSNTIFVSIIWVSSCKPFSIWIGFLFFFYFVYSQVVTIMSISLEFGFFNTLILIVYITLITILYIYLYLLIIVQSLDLCNSFCYFSTSIKQLLPTILSFVTLIVLNTIVLLSLKNFVIILVYS